jgi:hypothetical protein
LARPYLKRKIMCSDFAQYIIENFSVALPPDVWVVDVGEANNCNCNPVKPALAVRNPHLHVAPEGHVVEHLSGLVERIEGYLALPGVWFEHEGNPCEQTGNVSIS